MACNLISLFVHFADRKRCISKCKICHWRCANSQEKSQLKLEPNIASDTLSNINLFLPGSAGRDVTAIFNISFSRNKTVGVIYFSANLWMDAPRKLCLCIPLPIFKLCCSVLHDTAELSKPQKVINHQNKNALT